MRSVLRSLYAVIALGVAGGAMLGGCKSDDEPDARIIVMFPDAPPQFDARPAIDAAPHPDAP